MGGGADGAALRLRERGRWKGRGVAAALQTQTAPPAARETTAADWLMMLGDFYCNTRLESRVYWPWTPPTPTPPGWRTVGKFCHRCSASVGGVSEKHRVAGV